MLKGRIDEERENKENLLSTLFSFFSNEEDEFFEGIYDSMLRCLMNSKGTDLSYICNKLHLEKCETMQELIQMIGQLKTRIKDHTINGFGLDFLFRALCEALESKSMKLGLEDVKFIIRKLNIFVEMHDREVLLSKYALEFI